MRDFWFTAVWSPPLNIELREWSVFTKEALAAVRKVASRDSVVAAVEEQLGAVPSLRTAIVLIWKCATCR